MKTNDLDFIRTQLTSVLDEIQANPAKQRPMARALAPLIEAMVTALTHGDADEACRRALGAYRSIGEDSVFSNSKLGCRLAAALTPLLVINKAVTMDLDFMRTELTAVLDEIQANPAKQNFVANVVAPFIEIMIAAISRGDMIEAYHYAVGTQRIISDSTNYLSSKQGKRLAAAIDPLFIGE